MSANQSSFIVDAVLFDMDGTLVDSIAAVEAAWGKVAVDIGQDPDFVIAATHGKRAIDNLKQFKPHLLDHELPGAVQTFEESILAYADEYSISQKQRTSRASSFASASSGALSLGSGSASSSRRSSAQESEKYDFGFESSKLSRLLGIPYQPTTYEDLQRDMDEAWEIEADVLDRSVKILPGVRRMIDSLPGDRFCVATSGAKTYAYGAMTRVGITPPPVTITADDPRLKAGKPAPDPFLLAAKCLGYSADKCVVFEDSPSGIRAGVASGAVVVALCTSHEKLKIENCGAHYLIENMEQIQCTQMKDGKLKFDVKGLLHPVAPHACAI